MTESAIRYSIGFHSFCDRLGQDVERQFLVFCFRIRYFSGALLLDPEDTYAQSRIDSGARIMKFLVW